MKKRELPRTGGPPDEATRALAEALLDRHGARIAARAFVVATELCGVAGLCAMVIHRSHATFESQLPHTHPHEKPEGDPDTLIVLRTLAETAAGLAENGATRMAESLLRELREHALANDELSVVVALHDTVYLRKTITVPGVPVCPACAEKHRVQ